MKLFLLIIFFLNIIINLKPSTYDDCQDQIIGLLNESTSILGLYYKNKDIQNWYMKIHFYDELKFYGMAITKTIGYCGNIFSVHKKELKECFDKTLELPHHEFDNLFMSLLPFYDFELKEQIRRFAVLVSALQVSINRCIDEIPIY